MAKIEPYTVYTYPSVSTCGQPIIINEEVCTGCNACVEVCPIDVFAPNRETGKAPHVQHPDECYSCGVCVMHCPLSDEGAIDYRHPIMWAVRWKRKETGEHFRLGVADPPDPSRTPPVPGGKNWGGGGTW